jgi:hypothetical protein
MAVVEDLRVDRTKSNDLRGIVVLSILAVLFGAEGWEDIESFAKRWFAWLKKFIKLRAGVPSHYTISRVFRIVRPDASQEAI